MRYVQSTWLSRLTHPAVILVIVLLIAAYLRVSGHNWDQGHFLHPDERFIVDTAIQHLLLPPDTTLGDLMDPNRSPLNLRGGGQAYSYGTLPLYAVKLVSVALYLITGDSFFPGHFGVTQTGRLLTALFDALTVLPLFGIGVRLWSVRIGLFCAGLYALSVLPIQIAHIFSSEPLMTLFATCVLLCSILVAQTGKRRYAALAGLSVGLAMACKLSAAPLLVLPMLGIAIFWWSSRNEGEASLAPVRLRHIAALGLLPSLFALVGWFLADPYAVLDFNVYWQQVSFQLDIQRGLVDEVYTRKFVGTWPVLYPWLQLVLLGVNPLVGLVGTAGIGVVTWRVVWLRRWVEGLLLLGFVAYFLPIALSEARWVRYLLAAVPYLCLFAGALVVALLAAGSRRGWRLPAARAVGGILLASALLSAVAYTSIYRSEHVEVQASRWIYDNVPAGSKVGAIGDGPLPLRIANHPLPGDAYDLSYFPLLDDKPSAEMADNLRKYLRSVDYLTVRGADVRSTVDPLPWRYPVQIRYFELLFSGKLGFKPVYSVTSYPRLLGLQIVDSMPPVDPNFIEYDHHPVWVLHKERQISRQEWQALFADAVKTPSVATRHAP